MTANSHAIFRIFNFVVISTLVLSCMASQSAGNVSSGYDMGLLVLSRNATAASVRLNDASVDHVDLAPPNGVPPVRSNLTIIGCATVASTFVNATCRLTEQVISCRPAVTIFAGTLSGGLVKQTPHDHRLAREQSLKVV